MSRATLKQIAMVGVVVLVIHLYLAGMRCSRDPGHPSSLGNNVTEAWINESSSTQLPVDQATLAKSKREEDGCWIPERNKNDNICKCYPDTLVGLERISTSVGIGEISIVNSTNYRSPTNCHARQQLVVIIPFRDRLQHLKILLSRLTTVLDRQKAAYRILVVEQLSPLVFNKAMLMNTGFSLAKSRWPKTDCFIFHDVDLLPENDRNLYRCRPNSMLHLAPYVNTLHYKFFYEDLVGGATGFTESQFRLCNGFTNTMYGWGSEDDDLASRMRAVKQSIFREGKTVGRYTMIRHQKDATNPHIIRNTTRYRDKHHVDVEGLNTVTYTVVSNTEFNYYTKVEVNLPNMPAKDLAKYIKAMGKTKR